MSTELERLQKLSDSVRTGGKGSVRRKKKIQHKSSSGEDRNLQQLLKKFGVAPVGETDEVNLYTEDGKVMSFERPKVQASIPNHVYVLSGKHEIKRPEDIQAATPTFDAASLQELLRAQMGGAAVPGLGALSE